eukprot:m.13316 g.13316  ORF g.13316 m.13316 type:complete len:59 (-) comp4516_c1_seq1:187-363(-)
MACSTTADMDAAAAEDTADDRCFKLANSSDMFAVVVWVVGAVVCWVQRDRWFATHCLG